MYEDDSCSPPSSVNGHETSGPVLCQRTSLTCPKLIDAKLGPEKLPSTPTEFAYILNGTNTEGFEKWIDFTLTEDLQEIPLTHVILHYYCTRPSPRLQLSDGSNMTTPSKTALCGKKTRRQCLFFSYNHTTSHVLLNVKRNGGQFYLSEVQFAIKPTKSKSCIIINNIL